MGILQLRQCEISIVHVYYIAMFVSRKSIMLPVVLYTVINWLKDKLRNNNIGA